MKKAAIVVYVESGTPVAISQRFGDDGRFVLETKQLLHRSLLRTGAYKGFDIVACGVQETLERLPDDHVIKVPMNTSWIWDRYEFGKSIDCILDPGVRDVLAGYETVLRSDTDVFLTPNTIKLLDADLSRDTLYCGRGGYFNDNVPEKLAAFAAREGFSVRQPRHAIGSTIYGRSSSVIRWAQTTERLLGTLLTKDFADSEGEWPGWYRGVALLYAAEVAANFHHEGRIDQTTFAFDSHSSSGERIADNCVHIHCWHTDDQFSKFWWYAGKYDSSTPPTCLIGSQADYCMAMAMNRPYHADRR